MFLASLATADLLLILICLPLKVIEIEVNLMLPRYVPDGKAVLVQLAVRLDDL